MTEIPKKRGEFDIFGDIQKPTADQKDEWDRKDREWLALHYPFSSGARSLDNAAGKLNLNERTSRKSSRIADGLYE